MKAKRSSIESKKRLYALAALIVCLLFALLGFFTGYVRTNTLLESANELRFNSYQLVDQLRQSSDDLSRMARSYIATGNPRFKQQYSEILAIREGQAPRPVDYHRVYWDLIDDSGKRPTPLGPPVSLLELMRRMNFNAEEFHKFKQAKELSDELTKIESQAMQLVETPPSKPATARLEAMKILSEAAYHNARKRNMEVINKVMQLVDERTNHSVERYQTIAHNFLIVFVLTSFILDIALIVLFKMLFNEKSLSAQNAAHFSAIFHASPVPIVVFNQNLQTRHINDAFTKTFGYQMTDIPTLVNWVYTIYSSHNLPGNQIASTGEWRYDFTACQGLEHTVICKDGSIRKTLATITALEDQPNSDLLMTLEDVTAIKKAKENLSNLLIDHRNLIQSIPAGVYKYRTTANGEDHFDFVSQRFCEIFGVHVKDALRDPRTVFQKVKPEYLESMLSAIANVRVSRERLNWEGQIEKKGEPRWLQIETSKPIVLENDEAIWNGFVVDITDRKMAEQLGHLQTELLIAKEFQSSMLPVVPLFSSNREVEVSALIKPAKEVSGDFYDAFWLDHERICLAIGDVAGKGVPAALFMVRTITVLRTEMLKNKDVLTTIQTMNEILSKDNPMCMFVTLMIGVLDIGKGLLQYVNGGHIRSIFGNFKDGFQFLEPPEGMLVGVTTQVDYEMAERQLKPGDIWVLYTDGITEAVNIAEEEFTEQRLLDYINQQKEQSVGNLLTGIVDTVKSFTSNAEQSDDLTLLTLFYSKNREQKSSETDPSLQLNCDR